MVMVKRPLWHRALAVAFALLFLCCFQLPIFAQAANGGLLYGGAIQLGVQLMYDMFMIGINSAGGTDQIRVNFNNQTMYPTMKEFVTHLGQEFVADLTDPITFDDFLDQFGSDMRYKSDGTVIVGNQTAEFIHSFLEWCNNNGYISVSSSAGGDSITALPDNFSSVFPNVSLSVPFSYAINSLSFTSGDGQSYSGNFSVSGNSSDVFIVPCLRSNSSSIRVIYASLSTFTYNCPRKSGSGWYIDSSSASSVTQGGKTFYLGSPTSSAYGTGTFGVTPSIYGDDTNAVAYAMLFGTSSSVGGSAGYDVWNQDDADDGYVIAPQGALDGLSGVQDGSMAQIGDLLDTVASVIAGTSSVALPIAGTTPVAVSLPTDYVMPVDVAVPSDIAGTVPVEGDATEPYTNTGDYTLTLADFFPFCIPFDLYKMLSVLSADPVAPAFDYPFPLPGGGTYTIHLDLSSFNTVATVLRSLELLGFCVGLGFATKKLLFGS